ACGGEEAPSPPTGGAERGGCANARAPPATASSGGKAPDKNTVVDKMVAHPNAVAQDGSGGEKASGIHRQNSNRLSPPPILSGHAIDEAAFSASSRAGHSDNMRSSRMRINGPENGLHVRLAVFDQAHERRQRADITVKNLFYGINCHRLDQRKIGVLE